MDKIIANHKSKSEQVKKYKRKLKRQIPVSHLEKLLKFEQTKNVYDKFNWFDGIDAEQYEMLEIERLVRIELLEELIALRRKDK